MALGHHSESCSGSFNAIPSALEKRVIPKLVLVRHSEDPPDDRVVSFAVASGFEWVIRRPFKGDSLGDPGPEVAGTVIYGGPHDVFLENRYPFLREEARWIRACMDKGLPVLGICQGAQQIARLLGAKVRPVPEGTHEFGYYLIKPTVEGGDLLPEVMYVAQAHSHTFAIPEGAVHLAGSDLFPHQAFRYGANTYGFQFHPEVTIEGFRRWQGSLSGKYGKPGAQSKEEQDRLMTLHDAAQAKWFYAFLTKLFGNPKRKSR
jgi:GMP synthase (glutamine-hydrolysing)